MGALAHRKRYLNKRVFRYESMPLVFIIQSTVLGGLEIRKNSDPPVASGQLIARPPGMALNLVRFGGSQQDT